MRNALLVGSILCFGTLTVIACGSDSAATGDDDAGSSSGSSGKGSSGTSGTSGSSGSSGTSGSSGDGGNDGGVLPKPVSLKTGGVIYIGTTTDGYVAYLSIGATAASLEVVSSAGGAPVVIAPTFAQTDGVAVTGAAVAYWSNVTTLKAPATGTDQSEVNVGKLSYWTKATGTKANVEAASAVGLFYSSPDSSRIAFSVGATITKSDFAVTTAAAGAATPVITGTDALNVKASNPIFDDKDVEQDGSTTCPPFIDFVGKVFVAAYCTGTNAATVARLYTVPDASTTPKRLDGNGNGTIQPFWSTNTTADKIFVINNANTTGRIIFNAATTTTATLDPGTASGFMLDDGSAAVYRTGAGATGAIHRATAVAAPVKTDLVTSNAAALRFLTPDQKHGVYSLSATAAAGAIPQLTDLFSYTTGATSTPATLVATPIAYAFGPSADSSSLLYQTDIDQNGLGKLKSIPIAGGTEKTLLPSIFDLRILKEGTGSVVLTNLGQDATTMQNTVDLSYFDLAAGGTPTPIATSVDATGFEATGKTLVYVTTGATAGLFAQTLP